MKFRIILVIGDNHEEIAKKYSADVEGNDKNAHYRYEFCQQKNFEKTQEEGVFSDPFPLIDGQKSYSAHYKNIDWSLIHKNPKKTKNYERIWDIFNGDTPQNEEEETLYKMMINHRKYFDDFKNKEEFVKHGTYFWKWGVATENSYEDASDKDDYEWISTFFDKFIKPLEESNALITIYEVETL